MLHSWPEELQEALSGPDRQLFWATTPEQVEPLLREVQPEVVFSIKHSGFPGEAHRQAREWPSVRWFHVGGSGWDHLGQWDPERQTVTNSAGVLAPFHAERTLAGLLALSTGLVTHLEAQRLRLWNPTRFSTLRGRCALIVGVGRTGTALASLLKGLGMTVLGVRRRGERHPDVDTMYEFRQLPQLWARAEVLSLHLPWTPETHHLLDSRALAALPQGAIVLNGARGAVLHTEALLAALQSGHLGGAWLDVFEEEPLPADSPLWNTPGLLVSPHCADQVHDFAQRYAQLFLTNWELYRSGRPLLNLVRPPA